MGFFQGTVQKAVLPYYHYQHHERCYCEMLKLEDLKMKLGTLMRNVETANGLQSILTEPEIRLRLTYEQKSSEFSNLQSLKQWIREQYSNDTYHAILETNILRVQNKASAFELPLGDTKAEIIIIKG